MNQPGPLDLGQLVAQVESRRPADALAALEGANGVATEVAVLADRLVGYYVERARSEGHSWSEIGALMGISRQAAQQRFGALQATLSLSDVERAGGLARFTPRTRQALTKAEAAARAAGQRAVMPAHLLDAILTDEENLASRALARLGATPATVRAALPAHPVRSPVPDTEFVSVDPALRRALTNSVTEALALGHNYVGTEHLLLGLMRDPQSPESSALASCGVDLQGARDAVVELLSAYLRDRT